MNNQLSYFDVIILIIYCILLIGGGFYSMFKHNRSTVKGYFLANRQMSWFCIGASLFASNIGAEHFIGLASAGAAKGISAGAFELHSLGVLQILGWVFLPVFVATGVSTLPEYMSRRFGGQRIRIYIACLYLLLYILTKISVNIYAASLFLNYAFQWNLYLSVLFVLSLTAICTVSGGLASVMYTDTIQAIIMIIGGFILMILSYEKVGGIPEIYRQYLNAMPSIIDDKQMGNITNSVMNTCMKPTLKSFQMLRSASDSEMPWLGFLLGHTPNTIWFWCSDQMMVQRALAARSISHARGGTLLAGYLKILPIFMIIFPGMISRILYPDIVACNQPSICKSICYNERRCTNVAYPTLVLNILPHGVKGIMLAIMLAALISGLTSIFNSASTIFTVDIYPNVFCYRRKNITNRELMIVGRLFVLLMTAIGIAWIPVVIQLQGVELYTYMQQVIGFLAPPIACVYLLAILWTRTNERGAFAGLMIGFVFGLLRMILEFSKQPPLCGENDTRFWLVRKVNFMYYSLFLFWLTLLTCVIVSLCTEPPTKEQLYRTTFWTKNQQKSASELEQMVDTAENKTSIVSQPTNSNDIHSPLPIEVETSLLNRNDDGDIESLHTNLGQTNHIEKSKGCNMFVLLKSCWSWFCGLDDGSANESSHDTQLEMRNKKENDEPDMMLQHRGERSLIKWILNINLVIILLIEISLFILFSLPVQYTFWRK
ncbi:hypothetical protein I4U23_031332 [Adineta vaga]|nr:hypothetical protein I4U23_031332 [Adineta vaga]